MFYVTGYNNKNLLASLCLFVKIVLKDFANRTKDPQGIQPKMDNRGITFLLFLNQIKQNIPTGFTRFKFYIFIICFNKQLLNVKMFR